MSINFGAGDNGGRYFLCPDHADFTMAGDHTWLAVITPWLGTATNAKYFLSSGAFEADPSLNLYVTSLSSTWGYALGGPNVQTATGIPSLSNNLVAGRRLGGIVNSIQIDLSTQTLNKSGNRTFATSVNPPTDLFFGARSDLNADRFAQGYMSWVCLLDRGLTDQELADIASGAKHVENDFAANIVELWDLSVNAATITGLYKSHVLTRHGSGWGADGADPLPYSTGPVAITFNGSASNQSGNVGTLFNFDLKPFFTGVQTPFTYSVQSGALPDGLSLTNGLITGTPTTEETRSGIIIRGTDSGSATADSNAFSITIAAAVAVTKGVKITLNTRATLLPVGVMSGITARYWDSPTAAGAPLVKTDTATIDANGEIIIDVDSVTALPVGGTGYLSLYKQGAAPENDLHFAGRVPVSDIS